MSTDYAGPYHVFVVRKRARVDVFGVSLGASNECATALRCEVPLSQRKLRSEPSCHDSPEAATRLLDVVVAAPALPRALHDDVQYDAPLVKKQSLFAAAGKSVRVDSGQATVDYVAARAEQRRQAAVAAAASTQKRSNGTPQVVTTYSPPSAADAPVQPDSDCVTRVEPPPPAGAAASLTAAPAAHTHLRHSRATNFDGLRGTGDVAPQQPARHGGKSAKKALKSEIYWARKQHEAEQAETRAAAMAAAAAAKAASGSRARAPCTFHARGSCSKVR